MNRITLTTLIIILACSFSHAQKQNTPPLRPPITEQEITSTNEQLLRIFRSGNEALIAGRYSEAIALYDQGIALESKQPALWINKANALGLRGIYSYSAAVYMQDEVAKRSGMEAARQDFREAAKAAIKGVELINSYPAPTDPTLLSSFESQKLIALKVRSEALAILVTRVDESYAANSFDAFQDYINAEPDGESRHGAQLLAAQMLLIAHKFTEAHAEYQKLLDANPDDAEALLGAAAALIDFGFVTNDKDKINQGIDTLQRFVEKAPERHRYKGSAEEALSYLRKPRESVVNRIVSGNSAGTAGSSDDSSGDTHKSPIEGGIINGKALSLPKPPYPLIAKFARAQGTVTVKVLIDEEGNVVEAEALAGHPLLQAVAVEVARQAKFTPTKLSGQPIKVSGQITYNFVPQ